MDPVMKSDIFFFITSIAVILVSGGVLVAIYYITRSIRIIERLVERVEEKVVMATEEVREIGGGIKDSLIYNLIFKKRRKPKIKT